MQEQGYRTPLEDDHLCFNTRCVFPGHMEVVTRAENAPTDSRRAAPSRTA